MGGASGGRQRPLNSKRRDEDVDHDDDEDKRRGGVLQDVELVMFARIVEVPLHWKAEKRRGVKPPAATRGRRGVLTGLAVNYLGALDTK